MMSTLGKCSFAPPSLAAGCALLALVGCVPSPGAPAAATGSGGTSGGAGGAGTGGGGGAPGADGSPTAPSPSLAISGEEAATRLAKVLWQTAPDAALLQRAAALRARDDVRQLALDMLGDPRARTGVGAFYRWWLWLDAVAFHKTPAGLLDDVQPSQEKYPQWTPTVAADAANETETFAVTVTLDGGGSFETLLTAPYSFINQRLAALYGVAGITGDNLRKVDLDPAQRAGLLTQLSLLSLDNPFLTTDPPRRGRLMRDRFFCDPVPPIDPPPPLPMVAANASNRQFFEMATQGNPCHFCHYDHQLNALGVPFESFDQIGRFRTTDDGGHPVDVSKVALRGEDGSDTLFDGPTGLARLLVDRGDVQRCLGQQWLTFALGRATTSADDADLDEIRAGFKAAGLNLRALIAAVVSSEAFLLPPGGRPASGGGGTGGQDAGGGACVGSIPPDAGPPPAPTGALPEGCARATTIFNDHTFGCTNCHRPNIPGDSDGGFDMLTPGWERRLVGAGPPDCAPSSNLCKGKGRVYLNRTQPATGLFLDKLKPNPPCGDQMPRQLPPLSAADLACIQKWANNVVAGGNGQ